MKKTLLNSPTLIREAYRVRRLKSAISRFKNSAYFHLHIFTSGKIALWTVIKAYEKQAKNYIISTFTPYKCYIAETRFELASGASQKPRFFQLSYPASNIYTTQRWRYWDSNPNQNSFVGRRCTILSPFLCIFDKNKAEVTGFEPAIQCDPYN